MNKKRPKLRTVAQSLFSSSLNRFPKDFSFFLGKEIVYPLAPKGKLVSQASERKAIFATCFGAKWKPSNVEIDVPQNSFLIGMEMPKMLKKEATLKFSGIEKSRIKIRKKNG